MTDSGTPVQPGIGQQAGRKPASGARPPRSKSARRRSREFALQGLYEWLIAGGDAGVIDAHVRELQDFDKCDSVHFDALLHGCINEAVPIDAALVRHIDRPSSSCRRSSTAC